MGDGLRRAVATLLLLASIALAVLWQSRRVVDYNEQGRHFDPDQGIVLHQQAAAIYGGMALACAALAIALLVISRRR